MDKSDGFLSFEQWMLIIRTLSLGIVTPLFFVHLQLQYSCLENPMDRGAWQAVVRGVAGSRTWLSDFAFTSHFHALEKEMATHSSVLAWRIPGMEDPGELPSMGSHRVGHNWSDLAAAAAAALSYPALNSPDLVGQAYDIHYHIQTLPRHLKFELETQRNKKWSELSFQWILFSYLDIYMQKDKVGPSPSTI